MALGCTRNVQLCCNIHARDKISCIQEKSLACQITKKHMLQ